MLVSEHSWVMICLDVRRYWYFPKVWKCSYFYIAGYDATHFLPRRTRLLVFPESLESLYTSIVESHDTHTHTHTHTHTICYSWTYIYVLPSGRLELIYIFTAT